MQRSLSKNALVNLFTLLVGGVALTVLARYGRSSTAELGSILVGFGFLVSLVSWFQMQLEAREEVERLEVEQLSRTRSDSALFAESAAEVSPAHRARVQFERWLVPAFSIVSCLGQGVAAWWWGAQLWRDTEVMAAPDATLSLALAAGTGLLLFLVGKFSTRLAQLEGSRLLRPSSSAVMMGAVLSGLAALAAAADWFGLPRYDRYGGLALSAVLGLVAIESLMTLVLELYRPRSRGPAPRVLYESRIIGMLGESGGLFGTLAHALDYQFGFKVSETWIYDFLRTNSPQLAGFWLGILAISSSFVVIEPGEQGLLERFGRPLGTTALAPGLHLKFPWPIDQVERVNTEQLRSFSIGYETDAELEKEQTLLWTRKHYNVEYNLLVASRDQTLYKQSGAAAGTNATSSEAVPVNLLTASIPVQYYIHNLREWEYGHVNPGQLLEDIASREVVRYLASVDMDEIMSYGRQKASLTLQTLIQKKADESRLGVTIALVGLQDIHPPMGTKDTAVAAAFEQVIGAIASREARILEAEGQRAEIVPRANAEAARRRNEAQAEATRKLELASGKSAQFRKQMEAYQAAPRTYRQRAYLTSVATALGSSRKLVIGPTNTHDVVILNLEDKLRPGLDDVVIENPDRKK
jgi:regulator of protease activity HflC (stomatin/prohibitin superfamily)